jgi:hypothetical protein
MSATSIVVPGPSSPACPHCLPAAPQHFGESHAGDSAQLRTKKSRRRPADPVVAAFVAITLAVEPAGLAAVGAPGPLSFEAG